MTRKLWVPSPPRYVRRWAVQGVKPTGDRATTIFDLRQNREHVAVYPATVDTFAMLIDHSGVQMLLATVESRNACAIPGVHAIYGNRRLGLRPYQAPHAERSWTELSADVPPYLGPMELYVHLPDAEVRIIYGRGQLLLLQDTFTEILNLMP